MPLIDLSHADRFAGLELRGALTADGRPVEVRRPAWASLAA